MVSSQNHICNPPILDMHDAFNVHCASWVVGRPECIVLSLLRICVLSVLSLSKCVLPRPVVSEVPHESVAHRPVEMLPFICSRDQRKAAQLQVREHTTLELCVVAWCLCHVAVVAVREKMAQAYDFALDKIGMEIMSYQVPESEP